MNSYRRIQFWGMLLWIGLGINHLFAQSQDWSRPLLLASRMPGKIGDCSNVAVSPDQSLRLCWVYQSDPNIRAQHDTLTYQIIHDGGSYMCNVPCFWVFLPIVSSPWVVVDRNIQSHIFFVQKDRPGIYAPFFDYYILEWAFVSSLPFTPPPSSIQLFWENRDTVGAKCITACVTKYRMIYVAWEDFRSVWVSGKPMTTWQWTVKPIRPFLNFISPKGHSRSPSLFAGGHDTLYLAFVGCSTAEINGKPESRYDIVHFTKKPLNANVWLEPVMVYQDTCGISQQPIIIVDQQRIRHIVWLQAPRQNPQIGSAKLVYSYSSGDNTWSPPYNLSGQIGVIGSHQMALDSCGKLHVYWIQYQPVAGNPAGIYATSGREDQWESPQLVAEQPDSIQYNQIRLAVDARDRVHLIEISTSYSSGSAVSQQILYQWKDLYPSELAVASSRSMADEKDQLTLACYPNPFNETLTLSLQTRAECKVWLSIYNIQGQHVKTLLKGELLNGSRQYHWDGRTDAGGALPSGVYYAVVTGIAGSQQSFRITSKLLLLK